MNSFATHRTATAIPAGRITLSGALHRPADPIGLVLFAHGNAASRHGHRVAEFLHDVGLATLSLDPLPESDGPVDGFNARGRNDAVLLAERLRAATRWARLQPEISKLPLGYFGTGSGGTAALIAAADERSDIRAVVARGGRPDLADAAIRNLRVPTMLIVGGNDDAVAAMNLEAWARMRCEKSIEIIPGAGHLFEEPGALDNVASLAARWFSEYLRVEALTVV